MKIETLSIHFNVANIELKTVQNLISQWVKKHHIDLNKVEIVYYSPGYQFLQKYGLSLDVIKYITSLSPNRLAFWSETKPAEESRRWMFEYVNAHKGTSLFVGPLEGGIEEEFQMANEYPNIEIIQIESDDNEEVKS